MPIKLGGNGKSGGGPVGLRMTDLTSGAGVRCGGGGRGRPSTEIKPGWRLMMARDAVPKKSRAKNKTTAVILSVTGPERAEWDWVILYEQGWAMRDEGELTRVGEVMQEIHGAEVPDDDLPDPDLIAGEFVAVLVEKPVTVKGRKFFRYSQVVRRTVEQLEADGVKGADLKVQPYTRPDSWQGWANDAVAELEAEVAEEAEELADAGNQAGPTTSEMIDPDPEHAPGAADPDAGGVDEDDLPF